MNGSDGSETAIERQIEAADKQIDQLVCGCRDCRKMESGSLKDDEDG